MEVETVEPHLLNLLVILLFVLLFGGLGLVRREGLSARFALESLLLGGGILGLSVALGTPVSPIVLLLALYLVTMRTRWLTELANVIGRSGRFASAQALYRLALSVWPDSAGRQVVFLNQGAMWLKAGDPQAARETLEPLLQQSEKLPPKYVAAAHYNLGLAYERLGQDDKATRHYNAAIDVLPTSLYAVGARAALRRRKQSATRPNEPEDDSNAENPDDDIEEEKGEN